MQVITTIKDMNAFSKATKAEGKNIGFAPTMGALHKGHISLIGNSVEQNDVTVVSIF
ncbi:MAG TPA: pantoate--beta-alanine ligase, partial [Nitrospirae bacterium]|nr:pantoate--beta-alanine ligase [Nitrospirota bacterium]